MKITLTIFCLLLLSFSALAQKTATALATANGQNYTAGSLSPDLKKIWDELPQRLAETRRALLSDMIAEALLTAEARARGMSVEKLIGEIKAQVPEPSDAEIRQVYEANRDALGDRTPEQAKPQIVAFLRREPEQKALMQLINGLNAKYKPAAGKDVNAASLRPADVLATVAGKAITAQEFDARSRVALYEARAEVFDAVRAELEQAIFNDLVAAEAKAAGLEPSDLLAREITDRMRDFSDDEREALSEEFEKKLFAKYKVRFLLKEPAPVVQKISVDDDPSRGPATAPVTVVMFSDFQCPACAATHPVLEKVLAGYGNRVRFVVRDFPLTEIHKDAFLAAQAANAARAQGKFFEYIEVLYRNQTALDRESLVRYAAGLGLNARQFELDLQSGKFADEVRRDMADGSAYGITGTPEIFVNGVRVRELSARAFRRTIDRALAAPARSPAAAK